ncbi:serine hydrolase [Chitinophaga sp. SYP-B3965]|uniref:serine hydrolase domain-containing protein n=1 Tax=Chitinophaga sp. SYP-B3965 TaxID=2663120 RepID=UPI001299BA6E|nr:serine hydrolase domain-containing protein [Chitinophaga sp. SYP-B3965]MRG48281.1 serine hydrolase [Chitinophaga sp. SYP-B3965]
MKRFHFLLSLHVVLIFNPLKAQEIKQRLDSFLAIAANNDYFNGCVMVSEKGKNIYSYAAGYADEEKKTPNSINTCFNLASVSKPFTALAVLQLVQHRKCKLSDPVMKYFPDFPYPAITVRHLLSHTGGLPQLERFMDDVIEANKDKIFTNEELYGYLLAQKGKMKFPAGEKWDYSNMGYLILALLVEKISGQSFEKYMEQKIFRPAGMNSSFIRSAGSPEPDCAIRYIIPSMYDSVYLSIPSLYNTKIYTHKNLGNTRGPGNMFSTLEDLMRFDNALYSGKLLDTTLLRESQTPVTLNNGKQHNYGFGWNIVYNQFGDTLVYHDGHVVGIVAMMLKNKTKDQTIFFYDNHSSEAFFQKINTISHFLNGRGAKPLRLTKSLVKAYARALVEKGPDYAAVVFNTLKSDTANYYLDELEMNNLGYNLVNNAEFEGHMQFACEVLKLNTILFPKSANTYDSYAMALSSAGKKQEAIIMYQKALLLNPNNEQGRIALGKLIAK